MIHRNKKNLLADETQEKLHYKMYKAGKMWLFAGITLFTLGAGVMSARADTTVTSSSSTSLVDTNNPASGTNEMTSTLSLDKGDAATSASTNSSSITSTKDVTSNAASSSVTSSSSNTSVAKSASSSADSQAASANESVTSLTSSSSKSESPNSTTSDTSKLVVSTSSDEKSMVSSTALQKSDQGTQSAVTSSTTSQSTSSQSNKLSASSMLATNQQVTSSTAVSSVSQPTASNTSATTASSSATALVASATSEAAMSMPALPAGTVTKLDAQNNLTVTLAADTNVTLLPDQFTGYKSVTISKIAAAAATQTTTQNTAISMPQLPPGTDITAVTNSDGTVSLNLIVPSYAMTTVQNMKDSGQFKGFSQINLSAANSALDTTTDTLTNRSPYNMDPSGYFLALNDLSLTSILDWENIVFHPLTWTSTQFATISGDSGRNAYHQVIYDFALATTTYEQGLVQNLKTWLYGADGKTLNVAHASLLTNTDTGFLQYNGGYTTDDSATEIGNGSDATKAGNWTSSLGADSPFLPSADVQKLYSQLDTHNSSLTGMPGAKKDSLFDIAVHQLAGGTKILNTIGIPFKGLTDTIAIIKSLTERGLLNGYIYPSIQTLGVDPTRSDFNIPITDDGLILPTLTTDPKTQKPVISSTYYGIPKSIAGALFFDQNVPTSAIQNSPYYGTQYSNDGQTAQSVLTWLKNTMVKSIQVASIFGSPIMQNVNTTVSLGDIATDSNGNPIINPITGQPTALSSLNVHNDMMGDIENYSNIQTPFDAATELIYQGIVSGIRDSVATAYNTGLQAALKSLQNATAFPTQTDAAAAEAGTSEQKAYMQAIKAVQTWVVAYQNQGIADAEGTGTKSLDPIGDYQVKLPFTLDQSGSVSSPDQIAKIKANTKLSALLEDAYNGAFTSASNAINDFKTTNTLANALTPALNKHPNDRAYNVAWDDLTNAAGDLINQAATKAVTTALANKNGQSDSWADVQTQLGTVPGISQAEKDVLLQSGNNVYDSGDTLSTAFPTARNKAKLSDALSNVYSNAYVSEAAKIATAFTAGKNALDKDATYNGDTFKTKGTVDASAPDSNYFAKKGADKNPDYLVQGTDTNGNTIDTPFTTTSDGTWDTGSAGKNTTGQFYVAGYNAEKENIRAVSIKYSSNDSAWQTPTSLPTTQYGILNQPFAVIATDSVVIGSTTFVPNPASQTFTSLTATDATNGVTFDYENKDGITIKANLVDQNGAAVTLPNGQTYLNISALSTGVIKDGDTVLQHLTAIGGTFSSIIDANGNSYAIDTDAKYTGPSGEYSKDVLHEGTVVDFHLIRDSRIVIKTPVVDVNGTQLQNATIKPKVTIKIGDGAVTAGDSQWDNGTDPQLIVAGHPTLGYTITLTLDGGDATTTNTYKFDATSLPANATLSSDGLVLTLSGTLENNTSDADADTNVSLPIDAYAPIKLSYVDEYNNPLTDASGNSSIVSVQRVGNLNLYGSASTKPTENPYEVPDITHYKYTSGSAVVNLLSASDKMNTADLMYSGDTLHATVIIVNKDGVPMRSLANYPVVYGRIAKENFPERPDKGGASISGSNQDTITALYSSDDYDFINHTGTTNLLDTQIKTDGLQVYAVDDFPVTLNVDYYTIDSTTGNFVKTASNTITKQVLSSLSANANDSEINNATYTKGVSYAYSVYGTDTTHKDPTITFTSSALQDKNSVPLADMKTLNVYLGTPVTITLNTWTTHGFQTGTKTITGYETGLLSNFVTANDLGSGKSDVYEGTYDPKAPNAANLLINKADSTTFDTFKATKLSATPLTLNLIAEQVQPIHVSVTGVTTETTDYTYSYNDGSASKGSISGTTPSIISDVQQGDSATIAIVAPVGFDISSVTVNGIKADATISADKKSVTFTDELKDPTAGSVDVVFALVSNNVGSGNTGNTNTGDNNSGNSNSGSNNTGDLNVGNSNSGSSNTGNGNTGNSNSGNSNSGSNNIGSGNTGNTNTGDNNSGNSNSGSNNTGDLNVGNSNSGSSNTGNGNTGNSNSGNSNSGSNNIGSGNTGNTNTGDNNSGNSNSGSNNTGDLNVGNSNSGSNNTGNGNTGNNNSGNSNSGSNNFGTGNTGNTNTGDNNSGNSNSGSNNTGDLNVGNSNSGSNNTGNTNTGDKNSGNSNSGSNNTGDNNKGNSNSGSNNTGDSNVGNSNSGSNNIGTGNTGNTNSGNSNSGNSNSGSNNTGDSNVGNSNSGSNNVGSGNTGNTNTGDNNSGNSNSGSNNTGDKNKGNSNSGSNNTGDSNVGNSNSGSNNVGSGNTGNTNTGDNNSGNSNSGSNNTGDLNVGNSNSGSSNTGNGNTGNSNSGNSNVGNNNTGNNDRGNGNVGDNLIGNNLRTPTLQLKVATGFAGAAGTTTWIPSDNLVKFTDDSGKSIELQGLTFKQIELSQKFDTTMSNNLLEYKILSGEPNKVGSIAIRFAWSNTATRGSGDYVQADTTMTWKDNKTSIEAHDLYVPKGSSWSVLDAITSVTAADGTPIPVSKLTAIKVAQFDKDIPDMVVEYTEATDANDSNTEDIMLAFGDPAFSAIKVHFTNLTTTNGNGVSTGTGTTNGDSGSTTSKTANNAGGSVGADATSGVDSTTNAGMMGSYGSTDNIAGNVSSTTRGVDNSGLTSRTNGMSTALSSTTNASLLKLQNDGLVHFGATSAVRDIAHIGSNVQGQLRDRNATSQNMTNGQENLPNTGQKDEMTGTLFGLSGMLAALGLLGGLKRRKND